MRLTSQLQNYDSNWKQSFTVEKLALEKLFSSERPAIHHIGSTSVPGLVAKPEIDILCIFGDDFRYEVWTEKLGLLGYRYRGPEPGLTGHWYFSKNKGTLRTHKLHLCLQSHPSPKDLLIFRDQLRGDPQIAKAYASLKLQLENENQNGMAEYLEGKSFFIAQTLSSVKKPSSL